MKRFLNRVTSRNGRTPSRRRGLILPVVLVLIGLLALTMAGFVFFVRAETAGIRAASDGQQARLAAESAFEEMVAYLRQFRDNPGEWFDRPDRFRHVLVWGENFDRQNDPLKDSRSRAAYFESTANPVPAFRYSLVATREGGPEDSMRFGITPESGKLNLNTASERQISELVTPLVAELGLQNAPEIVAAILDWRDSDNTARDLGAENDYYNTLTPPYNVKNARFDTVEELLLVKGVTSAILWGEDVNRNGILDPNEDDGDATFPFYDNGDGTLNVGIAPYLTIYAREVDTALDNAPRFNLLAGQALAAQIATKFQENELSPETIAFLVGLQGMGINPAALRSPADLFPPGPDDTFESVFGNPDAESDTVQSVDEKTDGSFDTTPGEEEQKKGDGEQTGTSGKDGSRQQVKENPQQPPTNPGNTGGGGNRGGRGGRGNRGGGGQTTDGGQTAEQNGQNSGGQTGGRNPRGGRNGGMAPVPASSPSGGGRGGRGGRGGATSQPGSTMTAQMFETLKQSPITLAELPYIMDRFTTRSPQQQAQPIEGLININTAPARVLALIPNITPEAIQGIVQGRQTVPVESRLTTAWPLTAGVVDAATYKRIAPYITTKCYQFHVEALGYADHQKTMKRYEWIVEMVGPMPQVKYFRDLTALGMAWPIDSESAVVTEE